jgi:hypothetical protein
VYNLGEASSSVGPISKRDLEEASMLVEGGCHCGAIRYEAQGDPRTSALCHCLDCRRCAGAPVVAWVMFPLDAVKVTRGVAQIYESSQHGRRHFCGKCGAGLFYFNESMLPGVVDVQSATLDDPDAIAPQVQIQTAERIGWMEGAHALRSFERYPPPK